MTGLNGTCKDKLKVLTVEDETVAEFQVEKMITKFQFSEVQVGLVVDLVFSREVNELDIEVSIGHSLF